MSYKVAIAISGAVSLGTYEAGTVYELINAIKLHNENNPENEKISIDVLTGASAGGMTAGLVAQKLLYDAPALEDPNTNVGYDAWVKSVDISGLLEPVEGDNPRTSILSTGFVKSIADRLILSRYQQPAPAKKRHPASGDKIRLGLAMANMNGVDYARNVFEATHAGLEDGQFIETRHQDRVTAILDEASDTLPVWQRITVAARGCGAFPFAFSPIILHRSWDEADYKGRGAIDFSSSFPSGLFSFMDGGTFNNYPLGMARELAKAEDLGPLDYSRRFYFFISPYKKSSTADYDFDASSDKVSIKDCAARMVGAIFNQARFQDWLFTDKYNKEIALLDKRAKDLVSYVDLAPDSEVQNLADTAKTLCNGIFTTSRDGSLEFGEPDEIESKKIDTSETLEAALERLEEQYKEDYPGFDELPQVKKDAWLYSIALLEKAADLNDRDIMRVYTITASADELASEEMISFLGFLDKRFREYDYLRGRLNGRRMINHILDARADGNRMNNHLPLNIDHLDTTELDKKLKDMNLSGATIGDVDVQVRQKLYSRLKNRYYLYARNIGINRILRWAAFNFYLRGKLRDFLKLN
ncbi:MAG: patatin-like phospholipase family protein [Puniceicoccaceae bacterium]